MKSAAGREERFAGYLEACIRYWVTCGLSRRRIEMFKSEMAPSMDAAAHRGEGPEEIFGPAEKWARSCRETHSREQSPGSIWRLRLSGLAFYLLLIGSGTACLLHLQEQAWSFSLDVQTVALIVFLALLVSVSLSGRASALSIGLSGGRALRVRGEYLIFAGSVLAYSLYDFVSPSLAADLVRWSPAHSAGLILLAILTGTLHFRWDHTRRRKGDPEFRDLRLTQMNSPSSRRTGDLDRLALYTSLAAVVCFAMAWALLPLASNETVLATWLFSTCWALYLLFQMAVSRDDGARR